MSVRKMSTDESNNPQWNLGGKLVIKAQLNDDIRRIPIHNEDITYDELVLMMQRVFRGKLSTSDEVLLKYKDEDGDLVTIFDSSDLTSAIQCSRTLKLTVFLNSQSDSSSNEPQLQKGVANVNSIRKELAGIRDRVIHLLDQLEIAPQDSLNQETAPSVEIEKNGVQAAKPVPIHAKEFDPYQQHNDFGKESDKVSEAFGVESSAQSDSNAAPRTPSVGIQPTMQGNAQPLAPQLPNVGGMQQHNQQQPQGISSSSQHPIQQTQPAPLSSPYPSPAYQQQQQASIGQQRFQPPQTSTSYSLSAQQPSAYPQAGYSPQPLQQQQQPYPQPMAYNPQQGQTQPQQQQNQQMPGAPSYNGQASQPAQAYNPSVPNQGQTLGQPLAPSQAGFNYPGYQPNATTPTNPYSRGAQPAPPYASRPQPPQYR